MHISLLPLSSPPETRVRKALLEADLVWLREELAGAKSPEQRASIVYQIGLLEHSAGRDSAAVRQLLAAVNAVAHFKEPLERLIVLIERHRSFKNLPTLLEHLCRTAEGDEEVARAQLASAWCTLLHGHDEAHALPQAQAALTASPRDPAALLTLELLARRLSDDASLRRALTGRLEAASDPTWAALIGAELAESHAAIGEHERANELLEAASSRATQVAFAALERRFALGRLAGRLDWMIDSLAARASRISNALADPQGDAARLVPIGLSDRAHALDALLMQAELERGDARDEAALATLERAAELEPEHPLVMRAWIEQAFRSGRADLAEVAIASELGFEPTASEAVSLWLELGEARAARHQHEAALAALRQALSLDPRCWLARARELELARPAGESRARALANIAENITEGAARGRYWLLAADAYARDGRRVAEARDALAQAARSGVPHALIRRLERALAHAVFDRDWYDAAMQRLLASDVDDAERVGLELESWRHALLNADEPEAQARLARLELSPAGRRVAQLARAYAPSNATTAGEAVASRAADSRLALAQLAETESRPLRAAALGWALGLRADADGDRLAAIQALERVHAGAPGCAAVAGTLSAWLHGAEPRRAAEVLRATAAVLSDGAFAASLWVEAGLECWWAGDRDVARQDFEAAERPSKSTRAGALSAWARRASSGFAGEPEASVEPEERLLGMLERATRAAPTARELGDLNTALRLSGECSSSDLVAAARLASFVSSRALGTRVDPAELDRAASSHPDFAELVETFRYLEHIGQAEPSPRLLEETTHRWSDGKGGLAAALEWVAASARTGQRRTEHAARLRLSELLAGDARDQARAATALLDHLGQTEPAEYLEGHTPALVLTNLETSPPGCDPRRRARALDAVGDLLGEDAGPILGLLRGYNQLAAADVEGAIGSFHRYTDAYPDDPSGWEGLLSAARSGDDPALLAEATAKLGHTCRDPAHAARLFEEAAEIFLDRLGDEAAGRAALTRAVELDISRASSFARLFHSIVDTTPPAELLELIERRVPFAAGPSERAWLSWERARARRRQGDLGPALEALADVAEHDPHHVDALVLGAEIFITLERPAEAVERLARIADNEAALPEQRLTSGLMAVDLCENQLGETWRALDILSRLEQAGLGSLAMRERWARAAARSGAWANAAALFERLMLERQTPEERAEAARLALSIYRDELNDARAAGPAAQVLLAIVPGDPEVLDLALSGALDPELTSELLGAGRSTLIRSTSLAPTALDALRRLSRIAERLDDVQLRQATVGALVALGHDREASRAELVALERRISTIPPMAVSSDLLAEFADPEDRGPVPALLALVAPYLAEAFGPPRQAFALSRRERISARSGEPLRDEIAAWVRAFGLTDFDLYVSPLPSERLVLLGTEPLTVIAGASVSAPLGPFQRLSLARSLYAARRGLSPLILLEESDVLSLIAALCSVAGVELSRPPQARQRDFERQLVSVLPRKTRKRLHEQARPVRDVQGSLDGWVRAASASLDRVAAIAVGDASVVLADAPARDLGSSARDERARRLLSFMLSPEFEGLRQRFGVTVR